MDLYVGGYGGSIARVRVESGKLRQTGETQAVNPSYLIRQGDLLYGVEESARGAAHAFRIQKDGSLSHLGSAPTQGEDPCHLAVASGLLFATNYTSGSGARFALTPDGGLGQALPLLAHAGSGPVANRQQGAHPHFAAQAPGGKWLAVCDLGADGIAFYPTESLRAPAVAPTWVRAPAGSGPRHAAFAGNGRWYVACELSSELLFYEGYARDARLKARVPLTEGIESYPAALRLSPEGLLATNRGENSLALYDLDREGMPRLRQKAASGGEWPRDAAFSPDGRLVAVANQLSNCLTLMDAQFRPLDSLPLRAPACVLWA